MANRSIDTNREEANETTNKRSIFICRNDAEIEIPLKLF